MKRVEGGVCETRGKTVAPAVDGFTVDTVNRVRRRGFEVCTFPVDLVQRRAVFCIHRGLLVDRVAHKQTQHSRWHRFPLSKQALRQPLFLRPVIHFISKHLVFLKRPWRWECKDAEVLIPAHSQEAHSLKDTFLPGGMTINVKETDLTHPAIFQSLLQPVEYFISLVRYYI